jgi:hypothetical protein
MLHAYRRDRIRRGCSLRSSARWYPEAGPHRWSLGAGCAIDLANVFRWQRPPAEFTARQMSMWRWILVTTLALLAAGPAIAQDCGTSVVGYRVMHVGDRVVAVWYPTTDPSTQYAYSPRFSGMVAPNASASMACGRPVPLVIFSHGDLGCGLQSISFTEDLARHGYVVAAPDHADAFLCHIVHPQLTPARRPAQPDFFKPDTWHDTTFKDRRSDIGDRRTTLRQ